VGEKVAISKDNLIGSIWKEFYDRVNSQVVNTAVSTVDGNSYTLLRLSSSFPDTDFDKKSNYPMCIISPPSMSTSPFTASKTNTEFSIDIEIYANQSETSDKFMGKVINAIETGKDDLILVGLKNIQVSSTDSDMVERGEIKIHVRRVSFSFVYYYDKTSSC
jgi:hypothetical protein